LYCVGKLHTGECLTVESQQTSIRFLINQGNGIRWHIGLRSSKHSAGTGEAAQVVAEATSQNEERHAQEEGRTVAPAGIFVAPESEIREPAQLAGVPISVISGFRSFQQQQATFDHWASVVGYEQALRVSARPGHSEHQLGTALDFSSPGGAAPWEHADWATTPTGGWLAANAWRYGFVMTYPKGRSAVTCYDYEPWHYRYVGRDVAAAITASGLTSREYFWNLGR
jgi:hypothetical protein